MTSTRNLRRKRLIRIAQLGLLAGGVFSLAPAAYLVFRSYSQQTNVFFPKRKPVAVAMHAANVPGLEAARFSAAGRALGGWYAPARNRAAVILVHGAGGDRSSLLDEARALARAGFGVMSFDLPGHGESEGEIHWTEQERTALEAAVDWMARREDVDADRIGAYGFSLGGYVLAQVAAADGRLRAIALAGTPSDPVAQARFQHRHFAPLTTTAALFALRQGGMDLDVRARDFVAKLAPRPLLIVTGTDDGTVPRSMADELYAAAAGPRELLVLEGAGHGNYASATPSYLPKLVEFFEKSLE